MTSNLAVKEDFNIDLRQKYVPESILRRFGCSSCFYRNSKDCPFPEGLPKEGYCNKRIREFLPYIPDYDKKPTHSQILLDISKGISHKWLNRMDGHLEHLERKLVKTTDEDEQRKIRKEMNIVNSRLMFFLKNSIHYEDMQVQRETPKEIKVTQEKIVRPSDIADLIKRAKKVVDVKGKIND